MGESVRPRADRWGVFVTHPLPKPCPFHRLERPVASGYVHFRYPRGDENQHKTAKNKDLCMRSISSDRNPPLDRNRAKLGCGMSCWVMAWAPLPNPLPKISGGRSNRCKGRGERPRLEKHLALVGASGSDPGHQPRRTPKAVRTFGQAWAERNDRLPAARRHRSPQTRQALEAAAPWVAVKS